MEGKRRRPIDDCPRVRMPLLTTTMTTTATATVTAAVAVGVATKTTAGHTDSNQLKAAVQQANSGGGDEGWRRRMLAAEDSRGEGGL